MYYILEMLSLETAVPVRADVKKRQSCNMGQVGIVYGGQEPRPAAETSKMFNDINTDTKCSRAL